MQECRFIVVSRPGFDEEMVETIFLSIGGYSETSNFNFLETVAVDISSTQIRRVIANREPLDKYVPTAVAEYIAQHQLYR
jgi:nicotinate-nucleotide adenylyltransferase